MGETFYEFWPRTVFSGMKSAVEIEQQRLKCKGLSFGAVRQAGCAVFGGVGAVWHQPV